MISADGLSAFGVEHSISKSFIPKHIPGGRGGKYIKATQLTTRERQGMKTHFSRKRHMRRATEGKELGLGTPLDVIRGKRPVQKSYVPGVGWGKASELSRRGRESVKAGVATSRASRKTMGTSEQFARKNTPKKRQIYPEGKTPLNRLVVKPKARLDRRAKENPTLAGFSMPNGRGGGYVKVYHDAPKGTLEHEMAHVTPRRNPHTLQQRVRDPRRMGREEGRADFVASGKKTPGEYNPKADVEERKFTRGYNEVQRKMHNARRS